MLGSELGEPSAAPSHKGMTLATATRVDAGWGGGCGGERRCSRRTGERICAPVFSPSPSLEPRRPERSQLCYWLALSLNCQPRWDGRKFPVGIPEHTQGSPDPSCRKPGCPHFPPPPLQVLAPLKDLSSYDPPRREGSMEKVPFELPAVSVSVSAPCPDFWLTSGLPSSAAGWGGREGLCDMT